MGSIKIVKASAGSGKTYRLTAEYISAAMAQPSVAFKSILAVTFTNKATSEMKERILSQLDLLSRAEDDNFAKTIAELTGYTNSEIAQRAKETLSAILGDYSSFTISTIDKFFQRIVRSFFRELDLDVSYEVVLDQKATISQAIDSLIERSLSDNNLSAKFDSLIKARLSQSKKVNLHKELTTLLSGAINSSIELDFSGDIEAIESDIETLFTLAENDKKDFVALCGKVLEVLSNNNLSPEDFKGGSRSFATYFKKIVTLDDLAPYTKTFAKCAQSEDIKDYMRSSGKLDDTLFQTIKNYTKEVKTVYDTILPRVTTAAALVDNLLRYSLLSELLSELSELSSKKGELPISSTNKLLGSIVKSASVPFIFERLGSKYTTIFIDEFQDTSTGQWAGFLPLIVEAASQNEQKLSAMLIGDVKQAIYRWRGGDWKLLDRGIHNSPGIYNAKEEWLDTSWRSELNIVNFNNLLFDNIVKVGTETISQFSDGFEELAEELTSYLSSGYNNFEQKVPSKTQLRAKGYVEVMSCDDDERVRWCVTRIKELRERHQPSKIAILVRFKSEGEKIAEALSSNAIEFMSDELLKISGSTTICFIIESLRYIATHSSISREAMVQYLGEIEESKEEELLDKALKFNDVLSLVEKVVMLFELQDKELYYLQTLYNIIHNYMKKEDGALQPFLAAWDDSLSEQSVALPEVTSAVKILTIHKSKGLEYDAVLVPFATWNLLPSSSKNFLWVSSDLSNLQSIKHYPIRYNKQLRDSFFSGEYITEGVSSIVDNINLLYVALTRAKEELYIGIDDSKSTNSISEILRVALKDILRQDNSYGTTPDNNKEKITVTSTKEIVPLCVDEIISYNLPPLKTPSDNTK